jgi:hypothetical protein
VTKFPSKKLKLINEINGTFRKFAFLKSAYTPLFGYPILPLFGKKKSPLTRAVFKFFDTKTQKDGNAIK